MTIALGRYVGRLQQIGWLAWSTGYGKRLTVWILQVRIFAQVTSGTSDSLPMFNDHSVFMALTLSCKTGQSSW